MSSPALSVRGLRVSLRTREALRPLVDGVDFDLQAGTVTGLAGESGSGKTLTGLALLQLLPTTGMEFQATRLTLGNHDLQKMSGSRLRAMRGPGIAMVFQDPASAFDPVFTIGQQLVAAIKRHQGSARARQTALEALESVGFNQPDVLFRAWPHELSGGMRQLAMIALATALKPSVLIADEPTTALDVTTQALVLDRLKSLVTEHDTALMLVTHDLGVLAQIADRLMVMYAGSLVETGPTNSLVDTPQHPYTAALLAAQPRMTLSAEMPKAIPGMPPGPYARPTGCAFSPRCPHSSGVCESSSPSLESAGSQTVACHHPEGSRA